METLFSADSALMRGLGKLADIMLLNLVFIATSLPVVTLGASLTALNFTAMRIGTGECVSVTADYFRSFRQNFRQATILALILLLIAAVLAAWYIVVTSGTFGGLGEIVMLGIWYVLAYSFATTSVFVFPYLAHFTGTSRETLRNARLMSWKHPLTALGALAIAALVTTVTVFYPQATGYGLFWLMIGFAGIAVVNGVLFTRVFSRYVIHA